MFFQSDHLSLRYFGKKAQASPQAKLAPVVSKKNYKRAVDRNKLKRRARFIFRKILPKIPAGTYVLQVKRGSLELPFKELEKEAIELFQKIK